MKRKSYISQTVTQIKNATYLVLRRKPLPQQIVEDIEGEVEKRFQIFLNQKLPLLNSIQPEDPERFLAAFLLRGLISILDEMLKERNVLLSERDKNTIKDLFDNEKGFEDEKRPKFVLKPSKA